MLPTQGQHADETAPVAHSLIAARRPLVNMVMRSLAIDLAPRSITCVAINPGWVQTDMGGSHATLTPAKSVSRLRRLMDTLGRAQSGRFFNYLRIRLVGRGSVS
jgi:NAD(P)-dependent dehydrogenase (short-subunit alcohol dehydrogenase family)